MTKSFTTPLTAVMLLCGAAQAHATKEEVIVTAKGNQTLSNALATSHVFNLADIDLAQVQDIPELLDQITGLSVRDSGGRGSQTTLFVRGLSASQTIVLIDGVRVGSATLGAAALNAYPVEAIERIEVVKGPFSGIYGADAAAGVIQLFTKKGGQGLGNARVTIGSDSLTEVGLSLNGGNAKHSFHLSVHDEETDGIDRTSIVEGGNDDIDGFEESAVALGGRVTLSDNTIAQLSVLASDSTVEFDNTFGSDPGLMTETKTLSTALNITSQINSQLIWTNTLGLNEDESATNGAFPSEFTTNRDSIGTELFYSINDRTAITVGLDYYEEDIESSNDFPVTERDNKAAYVQLKTGAGAFGLVASLRADDNSAYGDITNGSLAVDYAFNDNIRGIASFGTSFVAPSFNFLYFPFFGNPDIQPEESDNAELSLIGNTGAFDWRVSAYQTDVTNLFSFDPATFLAANIGEAEIKGVELEFHTQLAEWDIGVNLDFLSAEDKQSGVELDDRAERSLAISAARSFGNFDLRFNLKSESDRFDLRGTELPSYALLDVSAIYRVNDKLTVYANIDNLFDKDYTVNLVNSTQRFNTEGTQGRLSIRYGF